MFSVFHPEIGPLKLGRNRPPASAERKVLRASTFMRRQMPKPPESLPSSPLAQPCLDQMLLNNSLGNCTCVATMKCAALVLGYAGVPIKFANVQAEQLYRDACGYRGTPETDQGGDEDHVIDYVTQHGIEKNLHHWAGKILLNGENQDEVKRVVSLTKNLYFGVELADAWLTLPTGSVLKKAGGPNPRNGHAFPSGGRKGYYHPDGAVITPWAGIEWLMPWDVLAEYTARSSGGELHSMISRDMLRPGSALDSAGFAWEELADSFKQLGGTLA